MNRRQQYAQTLRRVSATELDRLHAHARQQYESAKSEGHCSLEAVCYFDVKQIESEIERRKEP
jgi:hypothetical protein